jgi:hypothetical protein
MKMRTRRLSPWKGQWQNILVLGCTNLTLAPVGFEMNKAAQLVLVKLLRHTYQLDNVAKEHKT